MLHALWLNRSVQLCPDDDIHPSAASASVSPDAAADPPLTQLLRYGLLLGRIQLVLHSAMHRSADKYSKTTTDKSDTQTDRQGHVNSAVLATFLETARVEIFYDPAHPLAEDGGEFVIARLELDFLEEIQWPGTVTIGTAVRTIGNSSVTLAQAIFQDARCVAEAAVVAVQIDSAARRARRLSDATRNALQGLQLSER